MRTTITLEDDVAVAIDQLRRREGRSLRDVVNEVLRLGLARRERPPSNGGRFETKVANTGRPLLPDVDNVAEVLDLIDPERLG